MIFRNKKRILALALSFILLLGLLPATMFWAGAAVTEINLDDFNFTSTNPTGAIACPNGGWTYADRIFTILQNGVRITGTNTIASFGWNGITFTVNPNITVESTADITFNNQLPIITINGGGTFNMTGGSIIGQGSGHLILVDEAGTRLNVGGGISTAIINNTHIGGPNRRTITVRNGAALEIKQGGSVTGTGAVNVIDNPGPSHLIELEGGSVTISGGTAEITTGTRSSAVIFVNNSLVNNITMTSGSINITGATQGAVVGGVALTAAAAGPNNVARGIFWNRSGNGSTISITGGEIKATRSNTGGNTQAISFLFEFSDTNWAHTLTIGENATITGNTGLHVSGTLVPLAINAHNGNFPASLTFDIRNRTITGDSPLIGTYDNNGRRTPAITHLSFTDPPTLNHVYTGSPQGGIGIVTNSSGIPVFNTFTVDYRLNGTTIGAGIFPTNAGTYSVHAVFTQDAFINAADINLGDYTIAKADPTPTWPTSATITFGQTLADAVLVGQSSDGTFAFTAPTTAPTVAQSGNFEMRFTPTDDTNYNTLTNNVAVTVNRAPITSAEIHITAPTKGTPPNTTASGTGDFSIGTVSWDPPDNPFLGSTVYTASVTLTAGENHTFTGLDTALIDGYDATVSTNTGAAVTLSRTFGATNEKVVTGIAIVDQPTNLIYTHGNAINLAGLTVRLTYSDTTTEVVAATDFGSPGPGHGITTIPAYNATLSRTTHNNQPIRVEVGAFHANTNNLTVNIAPGNFGTPAAINTTYTTTLTLADLPLPNGYAWDGDPTAIKLNAEDGQTFPATFTDPSGNYSPVGGNITVNVAKAKAPDIGFPTGATAITRFQPLSASVISSGFSYPNPDIAYYGYFAWSSPDDILTVGTHDRGVRFHQINNNYESATMTTQTIRLDVTVNRAPGSDLVVTSWPPVEPGLRFYGTPLSGIPLSQQFHLGTFEWTTPETIPDVGLTNHSVTFRPNDAARVDYDFAPDYTRQHPGDGVQVEIVRATLNTGHLNFGENAVVTYNGGTHTFAVALRNGLSNPNAGANNGITVLYEGVNPTVYTRSSTPPTDVGVYNITVAIAEGTNFSETTIHFPLSISRTLTINKADPTVNWPAGFTATYGQTLEDIALPGNGSGTPGAFSWTAGNTTPVGNAATSPNMHNLTFTPTDQNNFNIATNDVPVTVNRAASVAPGAPTMYGRTDTSITLNTIPGAEYRRGTGDTWQDAVLFGGLIPGTDYTFQARLKQTDTHLASNASDGATFRTLYAPLSGTASISGTSAIGQTLTVHPSVTGGSGSLTYQWQAGGSNIGGATSTAYTLTAAEAGKTITCIVNCAATSTYVTATLDGGVVPYNIVLTFTGEEGSDSVTFAAGNPASTTGRPGDTIDINYVLANTKDNNRLTFTGGTVSAVTTPQTGSLTYTVYSGNAIDGVITLAATFQHTDLLTQTISFAQDPVNRTFGVHTTFTQIATGGSGTGTITYTIYPLTVATIDSLTGEVTIVGAGNATITATIAECLTHAEASESYTLTVAKGTQNAPAGLIATHETAEGAEDGTITGVTAAMEYRASGEVSYTEITGTTVTGLEPGTYYVRYAYTANLDESPDSAPITINAYVPHIPVTGITGVPTTATARTARTLTGTVAPSDATNQTIIWSVENAGTTGATISGSTLNTTAAGTVIVRATIVNGETASTDYTEDFNITVSAPPPIQPPIDPPGNGGSTGGNGGDQGGTTPPPGGGTTTTEPATTQPTTEPATEPVTEPVISVSGGNEIIEIPAEIDNDTGEVVISINTEIAETLIADAIEQAQSQGENVQAVVTLDLSEIKDATAAVLNVETAEVFAEADVAVTLVLPAAEVTLNPDALALLADVTDNGATPITVEASIVPMSDLRGMQAAQVRGFETVISLDVFVGDEKIDVPMTVSLPYNLKPNENPAAVRVWYMDGDGNLTDLNGVFDRTTGMITFTINHQSYFVVGYDPVSLWVNIFTDVTMGAWYYDSVAHANYYGLFSGYGGGVFAPQDSMTRAMFVTVLWNLEGNPAPDGAKSAEPWYHNAVLWAVENGITDGLSPDSAVTRQEMAVMLHRYANYKGYDIPVNRDALSFNDQNLIASWAETAVRAMSEAGVLNGYDNSFNPTDTATRAEVAQMFRNFMRFIAGVNDGESEQPVTAALLSNIGMEAYIDRSAFEAIQRALLARA